MKGRCDHQTPRSLEKFSFRHPIGKVPRLACLFADVVLRGKSFTFVSYGDDLIRHRELVGVANVVWSCFRNQYETYFLVCPLVLRFVAFTVIGNLGLYCLFLSAHQFCIFFPLLLVPGLVLPERDDVLQQLHGLGFFKGPAGLGLRRRMLNTKRETLRVSNLFHPGVCTNLFSIFLCLVFLVLLVEPLVVGELNLRSRCKVFPYLQTEFR